MAPLTDLTGQPFGRLVVIGRARSDKIGRARWCCRCDCGLYTIVRADNLQRADSPTTSCGCAADENRAADKDRMRAARRAAKRPRERTCRACGDPFLGTGRREYCQVCRPPVAPDEWGRAARRKARTARDALVLSLRRRGKTWQEIGDALGVSKQAARVIGLRARKSRK